MGAVFALFAAWYFWMPKIIGLVYDFKLAKMHFWVLFVGVNYLKEGFLSSFYFFFKLKIKKKFNKVNRFIHSDSKSNGSPNPCNFPNPENFVIFFSNVKASKRDIYKSLRNKSGVYLFINKKTNDLYVGSSVNLSRRLGIHFYNANSSKETNVIITRAMRKYGLENFSLAVLEFCNKDLTTCVKLEQKWIDYYNPTYNILKIAGNSLGLKHSEETIIKLKKMFSKEKHPKFGYVTSPETKKAISDGNKEFYRTHNHPSKGLKGILSKQYGIGGKAVFCYNKANQELVFPSLNAARQYFKVRQTTIKNNIDSGNWITLLDEDWILQSIRRQK
jgi:group I intron endonuclease